MKAKKRRVWTTIYVARDGMKCHHVEWGQTNGRLLNIELIRHLSAKHAPDWWSYYCIVLSNYKMRGAYLGSSERVYRQDKETKQETNQERTVNT